MKRFIAVALICFTSATALPAQSRSEKSVAGAVEQLRSAMVDGNRTELENIADAQLSYGHSGGHIDSRKEFVDKLTDGRSDFVSIDLSEQSILISGKTAIVRHILKAKTNDNGKPGEVQLRVMLVWQKTGGKWKLLARQAVKIA
jgi:hypothetical protein